MFSQTLPVLNVPAHQADMLRQARHDALANQLSREAGRKAHGSVFGRFGRRSRTS